MAKSELILAFNEIAEMRKLPREVIIDALKAALVSAYRRNAGISSAQYVEARVDEMTGNPSVWIEKEVVDEVQTEQTEVALSVARTYEPDAALGDMVLVDDTPEDFGRIAAQTAKQVILQRMREAEREVQYQEYQDRVGDLVTGTVQSDSGEVVTIGLGRTEAILPRSQQVPGEHYKMHEKVRAYVMEVRRTNRGPQIVVSRTHRNMLRKLLEYEVPEIYNGTVEIKNIAREPGARSKVAVAALQPGADPVGACVGMRGVRIQSIVRELNNEKIDVIEWSADDAQFISKALSPARVSAVFLDDDPEGGRTATVMVPDDQLSLAIGREGQNARLAAKLTGWRIDIKSITEAAHDLYLTVQEDGELGELGELMQTHGETIERVGVIMEKRAANKPIMPEDFHLLIDFVKIVEGTRLELREAVHSETRSRMDEARAKVPELAYEHPLDDTDLPLRVYNVLTESGYKTVGEVMMQYFYDSEKLLDLPNFGPAALDAVTEMVETIEFVEPVEEVAEVEPAEAAEEAELEAAAAEEAVEVTEEEAAAAAAELAELEDEEDEESRLRRAEIVAQLAAVPSIHDDEVVEEAPESEAVEEEAATEPVMEAEPEAAPERVMYKPSEAHEDDIIPDDEFIDFTDMSDEEQEELTRRRAKQRRRQLVFDEDAGRVVAKRRRKEGRKREKWMDEWDEYDDLDEV